MMISEAWIKMEFYGSSKYRIALQDFKETHYWLCGGCAHWFEHLHNLNGNHFCKDCVEKEASDG